MTKIGSRPGRCWSRAICAAWRVKDSNLGRRTPTDLQSVPIADLPARFRDPGRPPIHGRVGSALDNVAAEALKSTLKVDYIHRQRFGTRAEARVKIASFSEYSTLSSLAI